MEKLFNRRQLISLFSKAVVAVPIASVLPVQAKPIAKQNLQILDSKIAGFHHYQGKTLFNNMQVNDLLTLKRETDNSYDNHAIALYWGSAGKQEKIGFVAKVNNKALATLMDEGKQLNGRIIWLDQNSWEPVGISVAIKI